MAAYRHSAFDPPPPNTLPRTAWEPTGRLRYLYQDRSTRVLQQEWRRGVFETPDYPTLWEHEWRDVPTEEARA